MPPPFPAGAVGRNFHRMAEGAMERAEEGGGPPRSALWVSAGALAATLRLIFLITLITWSSGTRDLALGWERRTYEVVRNTLAGISGSRRAATDAAA